MPAGAQRQRQDHVLRALHALEGGAFPEAAPGVLSILGYARTTSRHLRLLFF